MESTSRCPECGALWEDGQTCQDYFHQMLFWENERPELGVVHHLMVLSYHLQHPSLYSPDGLRHGKQLLVDFMARGLSPEEVRRQHRDRVDSGQRNWKITSRPDSHGSYDEPISWTMTAKDVIAGGMDGYIDNVHRWAASIHQQINEKEG